MSQRTAGSRWALILAGGDGTRLRSLTRRIAGDDRPKQFCGVLNGGTLLEQTLRRTARSFSTDETLVVVVRAHEPVHAGSGVERPREPGRVIATLRHIGTYPDWAKREVELLA